MSACNLFARATSRKGSVHPKFPPRPGYIYDFPPWMVFVMWTVCCEVRAEAKETVLYILCEMRIAAEEMVVHRTSNMRVWKRRVSKFVRHIYCEYPPPRILRLSTVYLLQRCGKILRRVLKYSMSSGNELWLSLIGTKRERRRHNFCRYFVSCSFFRSCLLSSFLLLLYSDQWKRTFRFQLKVEFSPIESSFGISLPFLSCLTLILFTTTSVTGRHKHPSSCRPHKPK